MFCNNFNAKEMKLKTRSQTLHHANRDCFVVTLYNEGKDFSDKFGNPTKQPSREGL